MSALSVPRMVFSNSLIPTGQWTVLLLKKEKIKTRHQLIVSMEVSDWVTLLCTVIIHMEVWQVGVH